MDDIFEKYNKSVLDNLYKDNMLKILDFLKDEKCDYIEELIDDYLDLFTIDYDDFVNKYNKLNKKYDNKLLEFVSEDMNILEEFFND